MHSRRARIAGHPAMVTVVATRHSQAHAIGYGCFSQVLEEWPDIAEDMTQHTKMLLDEYTNDIQHLGCWHVQALLPRNTETYGNEFNPQLQEFRME
jgi:hypothetical protein